MKIIFIGLLIFSNIVFAENKQTTHSEPLPVLMHSFYSALFEFRPYIISMEKFSDKKNKDKVMRLLTQLEGKSGQSSATEIANGTGFNVTYNLLAQHIRDTKYLYEREIYSAAYNNVKATMNFCIGCHDRLPKLTQYKQGPSVFMFKKNGTLEDAEFYYIAHQFENALYIYNNKIRKYKKDENADEVKLALVRKLSFYTRIARDPEEAIKNFTEDLQNQQLPKDIKDIIKNWITGFESWKTDNKKAASQSDTDFLAEATQVIAANTDGHRTEMTDPSLVKLLKISGQLYEMAFRKKTVSSQKPELLYLLAKCERDLVSIRGYSLADIFLKECITEYPKSQMAKKCFADYEISMKLKFQSGSSEYINSTIETFRKLINKK